MVGLAGLLDRQHAAGEAAAEAGGLDGDLVAQDHADAGEELPRCRGGRLGRRLRRGGEDDHVLGDLDRPAPLLLLVDRQLGDRDVAGDVHPRPVERDLQAGRDDRLDLLGVGGQEVPAFDRDLARAAVEGDAAADRHVPVPERAEPWIWIGPVPAALAVSSICRTWRLYFGTSTWACRS